MGKEFNTDYLYICFAGLINFIIIIYFLLTLKYALSQICNSRRIHFMVYWFDILLTIFYFIILSIIFSIYILYDGKRNIFDILKLIEIYIPIVLSGNFLMNIILSFILIKSTCKIKRLKIEGLYPLELINFIDKIDIIGIYSIFSHCIKMLIVLFFDFTIISYIFYKIKSQEFYVNLYQLILCFVQIFFIRILTMKYNSLKSETIFSNNISNEKIYNITKQKIIILSEHLINKSIYDLILNIPTIIRFAIEKQFFKNDKFFISIQICIEYSSFFIYNILFGAMLLKIDKKNKNPISKSMKFFYFLKLCNNSFGLKNNKIKLFKPIIIDQTKNSVIENLNSEEDSYLNESDERLFNSIYKNSLDLGLNSTESKLEEDKKSKNLNIELLNKHIIEQLLYKEEKEFLPCNYFIIFKLLYFYFKSNLNVYKKVEKEIENEGIPFKNIKLKEKLNIQNIRDTVSKINRISIDNRGKIKSFYKFELKQLISSIDDKKIKEDFIKYIIKDDTYSKSTSISNKRNSENSSLDKDDNSENSNSRSKSRNNRSLNSLNSIILNISYDDCEFFIESLMGEILFDLYPFYQISINDILHSLDISNNKELLSYFFENKIKNNNFNTYYSKDAFLTFEIYDNNLISYSQLNSFILNYKNYLMELVSNFNYTFLPLILGIFNIRYLNYNKIIVLFRNPLSFTPFISYNNWINFSFSEENEIKNISTNSAEIIDINEIEVKDNIEVHEDEYNEIVLILQNDMNFLKAQNFELNFGLNLFIIRDIKQKPNVSIESSMNISEMYSNKNLNVTNNINTSLGILDSNEAFESILRDTSVFKENILFAVKQFKKYFGSDILSLLEKIYHITIDKQKIFRIYFTEIFKKKKKIIPKEKENENENSNVISNINISNSLSLDESEIKVIVFN